jgi:hypothetical protein
MKLTAKASSKLQKLIALLGSDKDGEVVATVRAIQRTLKTNDCDFHDLAKLQGGGSQIVYRERVIEKVVYRDRIVEKVVYRDRPGPTGTTSPGPSFSNSFDEARRGYTEMNYADDSASSAGIADWRKQAVFCYKSMVKNQNVSRHNEQEFIGDMYDRATSGSYDISEKQESWLKSIYVRMMRSSR